MLPLNCENYDFRSRMLKKKNLQSNGCTFTNSSVKEPI